MPQEYDEFAPPPWSLVAPPSRIPGRPAQEWLEDPSQIVQMAPPIVGPTSAATHWRLERDPRFTPAPVNRPTVSPQPAGVQQLAETVTQREQELKAQEPKPAAPPPARPRQAPAEPMRRQGLPRRGAHEAAPTAQERREMIAPGAQPDAFYEGKPVTVLGGAEPRPTPGPIPLPVAATSMPEQRQTGPKAPVQPQPTGWNPFANMSVQKAANLAVVPGLLTAAIWPRQSWTRWAAIAPVAASILLNQLGRKPETPSPPGKENMPQLAG